MLGSVDDVFADYIRCPHLVKYIEPDASAAMTVEVYTILATAAAAAPQLLPRCRDSCPRAIINLIIIRRIAAVPE